MSEVVLRPTASYKVAALGQSARSLLRGGQWWNDGVWEGGAAHLVDELGRGVDLLRERHHLPERDFCIHNLLVRIHFFIVMIRWTGLAPWEFVFPFPGSLTSTFQVEGTTCHPRESLSSYTWYTW